MRRIAPAAVFVALAVVLAGCSGAKHKAVAVASVTTVSTAPPPPPIAPLTGAADPSGAAQSVQLSEPELAPAIGNRGLVGARRFPQRVCGDVEVGCRERNVEAKHLRFARDHRHRYAIRAEERGCDVRAVRRGRSEPWQR